MAVSPFDGQPESTTKITSEPFKTGGGQEIKSNPLVLTKPRESIGSESIQSSQEAIDILNRGYKVDSGYNIDRALIDKAISTDSLVGAGFSQEDINNSISRIRNYQDTEIAINKILGKISSYKQGDGYDIISALHDNVITNSELLSIGVNQSDIDSANSFLKNNTKVRSDLWVSNTEWNKLNTEEQRLYRVYGTKAPEKMVQIEHEKADRLSKISESESEYIRPKGLAQSLWWGVTPWAEESGESLSSYEKEKGLVGTIEGISLSAGKTVAPAVGLIALNAIPIVGTGLFIAGSAALGGYMTYETATNWNNMSNAERGFQTAMIGLCFLPAVKGIKAKIATPKNIEVAVSAAKNVNVAQADLKLALDKLTPIEKAEVKSGKVTFAAYVPKEANALKLADQKLINSMSDLKSITPKQLGKIENLTGFEGLKGTIQNLSKVQNKLDATYSKLDAAQASKHSSIKTINKLWDDAIKLSEDRNIALKKLNNLVENSSGKFRPDALRGIENLTQIKNNLAVLFKGERGAIGRKMIAQKAFALDPKTGKSVTITRYVEAKAKTAVKTIEKPRTNSDWIKLLNNISKEKPKVKGDWTKLLENATSKKTAKEISASYDRGWTEPNLSSSITDAYKNIGKAKFGRSIPVYKSASTNLKLSFATGISNAVISAKASSQGQKVNLAKMNQIKAKANTLADTTVKTINQILIDNSLESDAVNKLENQINTDIINLTKTIADEATKTQAISLIKGLVDSTVAQTVNTIINFPPNIDKFEPIRSFPKNIRTFAISTMNKGEIIKLTKKQLEGSYGWKQGFIYKLWYPPFKRENLVSVIKKPPFVQELSGTGSPQRSLAGSGTHSTPKIQMGISKIQIVKPKRGKARLVFTKSNMAGISSSR